ncbi:MAG: enoyl-CoA hydratase/isomerase family protein [Hyphomicrobiales bacterium]|nr:enoyl-CoA hydratase/isomerase family protein [Hyphomicrobiales bacterium]
MSSTQNANAVVTRKDDGSIAILTTDNPPVNATSLAVRSGLKQAVEAADADPAIEAVVIACAGRTFFAGADVNEFGKPPQKPILFELCNAIEACSKPVVAAMHGTALGGGFEIALASHQRIMKTDARAGMPEVLLGLTPGAGGTQRLPRLIGLPAALDLITSGRQIKAQEALKLGAIDAIAKDDLLAEAIAMAREAIGKPIRRCGDLDVPAFDDAAVEEQLAAVKKKARGQHSPVEAAALVMNAVKGTTAEGIAAEREAFLRLMETEQSQALRHIFAAERQALKIDGLDLSSARDIKEIGVVGAGIMGSGISIAMADAGYRVTVVERDETAAEKGRDRVTATYARTVKSGRITQEIADERLGRISIGHDSGAFAKCDLVIEAVFDDLQVKRELFERLSGIVRNDCILATNTSYLNPNEIAANVTNKSRVVGMHFFAPANIMKLLEVVRAEHTAPDVLASAIAVGRKLGKQCVVAGVCTGFIGNRIYASYRKQCEFMLEEGATPQEIDAAIEGFGLPMGPFRAFDLSGLDISWALRKRQAATRDPAARYCVIPDRLCEAGQFGQKTGAGYYNYSSGKPVPDAKAMDIIEQAATEKGLPRKQFSAEDIRRRLVAAMANEGGKELEEGIALRESDIDLVFTNGYGWPKWRGGPMFQARKMGLDKIVAEVRDMQKRDGSEFTLSQWLEAAADKT